MEIQFEIRIKEYCFYERIFITAMEGNSLIQFIKGVSPIVQPLVSSVTGALMTTLFLRRNTKNSEFEKIKAGKFQNLIDEMLEKGKLTYLEYYKCNNFLQIARMADKLVSTDEGNAEKKDYDFDWFVRFYDYACNISNEDMQKIWSKVYAGEIRNPRSNSITLLHALSMMQQEQAINFHTLSRFALMDISGNLAHPLLFVSTNVERYKSEGITDLSLKELERLNLLECNFNNEYVFEKKKVLKMENKIITVYGTPSSKNKIKAGNVKFTNDGQRLYAILDKDVKGYNSNILEFIIRKFKNRNCQIFVNDAKAQ